MDLCRVSGLRLRRNHTVLGREAVIGTGENLKGAWANLYRNPPLLGRRGPKTSKPLPRQALVPEVCPSRHPTGGHGDLIPDPRAGRGALMPHKTAHHRDLVAEHPLMEAEGSVLGRA